jgi:hypothetical protein
LTKSLARQSARTVEITLGQSLAARGEPRAKRLAASQLLTRFNQRLIAAEKIEAAALLNVLVDGFDQ